MTRCGAELAAFLIAFIKASGSWEASDACSDNSNTFASISFPGLNVTTNFSGTLTWRPVRGLRAFLAARCFTSNTPKFRNSIRRSLTNESMIASNVFWTIFLVCCCVSPISSEIVRTMSFLVKTLLSATPVPSTDNRHKPLRLIDLAFAESRGTHVSRQAALTCSRPPSQPRN